MSDREKIKEAHWELAIVRLAALAEANASKSKILKAVEDERFAFEHWRMISQRVIS